MNTFGFNIGISMHHINAFSHFKILVYVMQEFTKSSGIFEQPKIPISLIKTGFRATFCCRIMPTN